MITPTQKWRKYRTERGICINEDCEKVIQKYLVPNFEGKIQLILTSPPFPLKRAKKYGNKVGKEYLDWLCNIGNQLAPRSDTSSNCSNTEKSVKLEMRGIPVNQLIRRSL